MIALCIALHSDARKTNKCFGLTPLGRIQLVSGADPALAAVTPDSGKRLSYAYGLAACLVCL